MKEESRLWSWPDMGGMDIILMIVYAIIIGGAIFC